ncbi:MAG TPA: YfjP family GTPase [Phycicoccus sp.]|nr:YfjP family GTPase [Phycicoccus sp.]HQH07195.1 YfjP family GTPase [Phycicoccus sp.]HQK31456.1 YfjP family GTPase [Phycicoccus sp.]
MSPLIAGRAKVSGVSAEALATGATALEAALETGGSELPASAVAAARSIVVKVRERTALVGGHTVVALAGATGSGKSTLFNALVGTSVATVGARRPTTSTPSAATWGPEPVGELLDWLQVSTRHDVTPESAPPVVGSLDGLVLLDLPDFDSREVANRAEAERVLGLVDLFVWVTDPQKYADSRLHDDYVAALSSHDAVMLVVLNQVDLLTPAEAEQCMADLRRLLERDGIRNVSVLPTSARTGEGVDALRQRLVNTVTGRDAARSRLAADVRVQAQSLTKGVGAREPEVKATEQSDLVDALARSAGVPMVVDAVDRDYRMEAIARTGWPFTRWVQAFRPKPLRRLRLEDKDIKFSEQEVRAVLGRSSIPPPTPAARAAVSLATRNLAGRAGDGLPVPWAEAVDSAVRPAGGELTDALDRAVMSTPLRGRNPIWWRVVGVLQTLLALAAIAGLLWYAVLWVMTWLQFPHPSPPLLWDFVPVPFLLLVGGLVLGLLFAALSRAFARVGARRRAAGVEKKLRGAIADVADTEIIAPVAAVLERHAQTRRSLEVASSI